MLFFITSETDGGGFDLKHSAASNIRAAFGQHCHWKDNFAN
jgi:hypothetical protein